MKATGGARDSPRSVVNRPVLDPTIESSAKLFLDPFGTEGRTKKEGFEGRT